MKQCGKNETWEQNQNKNRNKNVSYSYCLLKTLRFNKYMCWCKLGWGWRISSTQNMNSSLKITNNKINGCYNYKILNALLK